MIELFVSSLITFFVVIDPPGCAPIYAGLTAGASPVQRRAMAVRAVVVSALILLLFALFGEPLLHGLGIELASFRIAGGIMLFLIALEMVFEKRTQRREDRAADRQRAEAAPEQARGALREVPPRGWSTPCRLCTSDGADPASLAIHRGFSSVAREPQCPSQALRKC